MLFSWGANSHGQLGLGRETEQEETPQKVMVPFKEIRKMCGGGSHVLILTSTGKIYSCGYNDKGQLGIDNIEDKSTFQLVHFTEDSGEMIKISCGWDSSASISANGDLYVWGSNNFNQLGISITQLKFSTLPIKLILPVHEKIIKVKLGLRFTCILTESNTLYLVGKSKCLDVIRTLPNTQIHVFNNVEFLKCSFNEKLCKISCGQNHLIIQTTSKFLMFGDNKFNQCGEFHEIETKIIKVMSGWTHNAYLTVNGEVFLWGRNNYGQLGFRSSKSSIPIPTKLNIMEKVSQLNLGSEHGLIVTDYGGMFTFGWNEHGNCGNGNTDNVFQPHEILLDGKCIKSCCGAGFCYAMLEN